MYEEGPLILPSLSVCLLENEKSSEDEGNEYQGFVWRQTSDSSSDSSSDNEENPHDVDSDVWQQDNTDEPVVRERERGSLSVLLS